MPAAFDDFRIAVLDLIALRNERLGALLEPDPDYRAALEVFGPEEVFSNYPDAAALMLVLRTVARQQLLEGLRFSCQALLSRG